MILNDAIRDALRRLQYGFGIYCPENDIAKQTMLDEATQRIKRLGATPEQVGAAIDDKGRKWDIEPNKPRALSGIYLYSIVRAYLYKTKQKTDYEPITKDLTDADFAEFLEYCFAAYQSGGRKWAVVRAGSGWMVDRLGLDYEPHMGKAHKKVTSNRLDEARGYGIFLEQAALAQDQDAVTAEAKRIAMQEYFKKRHETE